MNEMENGINETESSMNGVKDSIDVTAMDNNAFMGHSDTESVGQGSPDVMEQNDMVLVSNTQQEEQQFCVKCGAQIFPEQIFCPKCGQKVGEKLSQPEMKKTADKKIIGIIAGAAVIVLVVAVFLLRGVQAKDVTLNKDALIIKVGESEELTYIINPDNTKDKTVKWESSNESIAVVDNGNVTAKNEGNCSITVKTKNGKTDICEITVEPAGPDLVSIYNKCCDSSYASIASDGSYLSIDTNPDNSSSNTLESTAIVAIFAVNEALGLPESVINKMGQTRSLDGMQSYEGDGIEVSWTYHPDNGLEIMYSLP